MMRDGLILDDHVVAQRVNAATQLQTIIRFTNLTLPWPP
jgi:hypothetical protein